MEGSLAVPHGDHESRADEQEDLAERDNVVPLGKARGLEDEKERVAVDVQLRSLVRLDGVLDRQLVQVEFPPRRVELGDGRIQEPDPRERAVVSDRVVRILDG